MWQKNYCATCHNFGPLLIIIINDGDQSFENKIIFMSKNLHSVVSNFNKCIVVEMSCFD